LIDDADPRANVQQRTVRVLALFEHDVVVRPPRHGFGFIAHARALLAAFFSHHVPHERRPRDQPAGQLWEARVGVTVDDDHPTFIVLQHDAPGCGEELAGESLDSLAAGLLDGDDLVRAI
jgi:hypothetical protein